MGLSKNRAPRNHQSSYQQGGCFKIQRCKGSGSEEAAWDAMATCFFLDTAKNVLLRERFDVGFHKWGYTEMDGL